MDLQTELDFIISEGNDEEKQVLSLAVQAIKQKRERNSAYMSGFLGLKGSFVGEDEYEFSIPITPFMMNGAGMVHGGITATLADSVMGSLIYKRMPEDAKGVVTADMNVRYLAPGRGKQLISRAKLLRMGSSLASASCEIRNEKNHLITHATATFFIIR
ncbi:PaaI family thioesterase [Thermoactinomyces mirandus]|nr:PaaI family thioesterase [Thermoactinomyces mirandus]